MGNADFGVLSAEEDPFRTAHSALIQGLLTSTSTGMGLYYPLMSYEQ